MLAAAIFAGQNYKAILCYVLNFFYSEHALPQKRGTEQNDFPHLNWHCLCRRCSHLLQEMKSISCSRPYLSPSPSSKQLGCSGRRVFWEASSSTPSGGKGQRCSGSTAVLVVWIQVGVEGKSYFQETDILILLFSLQPELQWVSLLKMEVWLWNGHKEHSQ